MKKKLRFGQKRIAIIVCWTFLLQLIVVYFARGGHGTFLPAKLVYPYTMIIASFEGYISSAAMVIAIIQIPVYTWLFSINSRSRYWIMGLHTLLAIIACTIQYDNF